jgi:glutathione peroxidase
MSADAGTIHGFQVQRLDGTPVSLGEFRGQVLLVVNTASQCGFTPQYAGLERLYLTYRDRGFAVLGFPCDQFGGQEPGSAAEIGVFCQKNYGVSFPMFAKIEVNGPNTHPLYAYLKRARPGIFGTPKIKWNFTKFLIDRQGRAVARFAPAKKPETLAAKIERLLGESSSK